MPPKKPLISRFKSALARIKDKGLLSTLRHYLHMIGFEIATYYYMKEMLPADIPAELTALPEDFVFSVFGPEEMAMIDKLPEREGYVAEDYMAENIKLGDTCLGIKHNGKIAAFTWTSLDKVRGKLHDATMKPNEAYLFDMYVLKEFRGKNLAPILRYKNYEALRALGRDTFYSITLASNTASIRFKRKLNAQLLLKAVHFDFFKILRWRWVLKKYSALSESSRSLPASGPG